MNPKFLVVDLFCGAGGTTTGFAEAMQVGPDGKLYPVAKVIACVNHDPVAIKSHWENHPDVKHFSEDIRTLDLTELVEVARHWRRKFPEAKLILWASLECTNFSNAKGGKPRDADSRTLADHLHRYVEALMPNYVQIENVVEFMSWGPLDAKGKPISRRAGRDWLRWCSQMDSHGYRNEWRTLNSADFGAYTSRKRLFGCFARHGLPITWPEPTHAKDGGKVDAFGGLQKWKPVRDVLDLQDHGVSIFGRKTPLSIKTLERIYAGLVKYVAGVGTDKWLLKYNSTSRSGVHVPPSIFQPCPVLATQDRVGVVSAEYLIQYNNSTSPYTNAFGSDRPMRTLTAGHGAKHNVVTPVFLAQRNAGKPQFRIVSPDGPARTLTSTAGNQDLVQPIFIAQRNFNNTPSGIDQPARTLTTNGGNQDMVTPVFISKYNSGKPESRNTSLDEPCHTVMTENRHAAVFLSKQYSGHPSSKNIPVDGPTGAMTTTDSHALVGAEFLSQYYGSGFNTDSGSPAPTLTTKDRCALVQPEFIMQSNGGVPSSKSKCVDQPCYTLTCSDNKTLVQPQWLHNPAWFGHTMGTEQPCPVIVARQDKSPLYVVNPQWVDRCYSGTRNHHSIEVPSGTLTQKDHSSIVTPHWIDRQYSGPANHQSLDVPSATVTANPHSALYSVMATNFDNKPQSIEQPAPTITANRKWHYMLAFENGAAVPKLMIGRNPVEARIRWFMAIYGLADIKMRMLKVPELLRIQGFPKEYKLAGTQTDQKKFIGNSVVPHVVTAWCLAMGGAPAAKQMVEAA